MFVCANTPWVFALAQAVAAQGSPTCAIEICDLVNHGRSSPRRKNIHWPPRLLWSRWVYPPGYVGCLEPLFRILLSSRIQSAYAALRKGHGFQAEGLQMSEPWVIAPYPWFAACLRAVPGTSLVYYNLDDYTLYRPERAITIRKQEEELIQRAALTLCLSHAQTSALRQRFPGRASSIRHFPLGVVEGLINQNSNRFPSRRTVSYVGNLIDRVDWRLVAEVARGLPAVEFVFVGGLDGFGGGGQRIDWQDDRKNALVLSNVRHVGPVPQSKVAEYYWNCGIFWIPYAVDHRFNEASCPTKIMDGIASGHPVLSTDVPECRMYPQWITIIHSAKEAIACIERLFDGGGHSRSAAAQLEFARDNSWNHRAETLQTWLSETQCEP